MNRENVEAWVAALRSGEYQQGTMVLRRGDKFCCLGVACDLAEKAGIIKGFKGNDFGEDVYSYGGEPHELPIPVQDWLGIDHTIKYHGMTASYITLNDISRLSFEEIAAVIEEEYLK